MSEFAELPLELYDDEDVDDVAFCSNWMSCCSRSAADVVELELDDESLDDESSDGGGPGGGPPAPPGPCAKVALKTSFSSVAWSLVSLPEETSFEIRLSIFDLRSPGWDCEPLEDELDAPLFSAASMSVSADDSAVPSDELIAPELTSDCSSACSFCRGD